MLCGNAYSFLLVPVRVSARCHPDIILFGGDNHVLISDDNIAKPLALIL